MVTLVEFPYEKAVELNTEALNRSGGLRGSVDEHKLRGALARVDQAIHYEGLSDVFTIAARLALSVAAAHAFLDGNKRTGYLIALEFLATQDLKIEPDWEESANAMEALVIKSISEKDFATYLYGWHKKILNNR